MTAGTGRAAGGLVLAVLATAVLAAGCRGREPEALTAPPSPPSPEASTPRASGSYFPLVPGARWERRAGDGGRILVEVAGRRSMRGAACTVLRTTTVRAGRERIAGACYEATPSEIRVLETESGGRWSRVDPPRTLLRLPPAAGTAWSWTARRGGTVVRDEWVGEETVRVAAGTFRAWKVRTVTTRGDLTITLLTWYAPGVGIVKIERQERRPGMAREGDSELVRYAVP